MSRSPQEISPTLSTSDLSSSPELYAQLRSEIDALRAASETNRLAYEKTIAVAQSRIQKFEKENTALRQAQLANSKQESARVATLRELHELAIAEMRKDNLKLYAHQMSVQTSYNQLKVRYDAVCIEKQMLILQLEPDNNLLSEELEAALADNKIIEQKLIESDKKNQNLLKSIATFQARITLLEKTQKDVNIINLQRQQEEIQELRSKVTRLEKKEIVLGLKAKQFQEMYSR